MKKLLTLTTAALVFSAPAVFAEEAKAPPPHHKGGMFEKLDTDGDGKVTKAEFEAFHAEKFTKMDADGDGVVTKEEAAAAREKFKEHRGKKGERHHKAPPADAPVEAPADAPAEGAAE